MLLNKTYIWSEGLENQHHNILKLIKNNRILWTINNYYSKTKWFIKVIFNNIK